MANLPRDEKGGRIRISGGILSSKLTAKAFAHGTVHSDFRRARGKLLIPVHFSI
jgi:hypothetical protein